MWALDFGLVGLRDLGFMLWVVGGAILASGRRFWAVEFRNWALVFIWIQVVGSGILGLWALRVGNGILGNRALRI